MWFYYYYYVEFHNGLILQCPWYLGGGISALCHKDDSPFETIAVSQTQPAILAPLKVSAGVAVFKALPKTRWCSWQRPKVMLYSEELPDYKFGTF